MLTTYVDKKNTVYQLKNTSHPDGNRYTYIYKETKTGSKLVEKTTKSIAEVIAERKLQTPIEKFNITQ